MDNWWWTVADCELRTCLLLAHFQLRALPQALFAWFHFWWSTPFCYLCFWISLASAPSILLVASGLVPFLLVLLEVLCLVYFKKQNFWCTFPCLIELHLFFMFNLIQMPLYQASFFDLDHRTYCHVHNLKVKSNSLLLPDQFYSDYLSHHCHSCTTHREAHSKLISL